MGENRYTIPAMPTNPPRHLIILGLIFAATGFFAVRFPDAPGASVGSLLSTLVIALPTLVAFWRFLGTKTAALSLAALSALGFAVEAIGVVTGFPYGEFYYSDALGPKVAGIVPSVLPLSWVPLVLGAVAAAKPSVSGRPLRRALWILLAAVLLVAIDGVLDPGAARLGLWVWPEGGAYYGVPLRNYAGWLLSSTLAATLVLVLGNWWKHAPPAPGLLDSCIVSLAFWTAVALSAKLSLPALLGGLLIAYLLIRRRRLSDLDNHLHTRRHV
jgi:bisanhydrobacterioruberin hydratase